MQGVWREGQELESDRSPAAVTHIWGWAAREPVAGGRPRHSCALPPPKGCCCTMARSRSQGAPPTWPTGSLTSSPSASSGEGPSFGETFALPIYEGRGLGTGLRGFSQAHTPD